MSYFPLLILLVDSNKKMIVETPEDIPNGVGFKVLKTNYTKLV